MGAIPKREGATLRETMEQFLAFVEEHFPGDGSRYYGGDLDLVLREGRSFESVPWKTWRGRGYRRAKARECFKNAYQLACANPELTYCEGYASTGLLPVHHAWCVTPTGRVVDPTWREDGRDPVETWEYLGVPFELAFVEEVIFAKFRYGVIDDQGLYKEPLPDGAIRHLEREGG